MERLRVTFNMKKRYVLVSPRPLFTAQGYPILTFLFSISRLMSITMRKLEAYNQKKNTNAKLTQWHFFNDRRRARDLCFSPPTRPFFWPHCPFCHYYMRFLAHHHAFLNTTILFSFCFSHTDRGKPRIFDHYHHHVEEKTI
jgi:hypothetical protein